MATRKIITLVCDSCGREESEEMPVASHVVRVDKRSPVGVDACGDCWDAATGELDALLEQGRRLPRTSLSRI